MGCSVATFARPEFEKPAGLEAMIGNAVAYANEAFNTSLDPESLSNLTSADELSAIEMPDIGGFNEDGADWTDALSAFNAYEASIPDAPTQPTISESAIPIPTFTTAPDVSSSVTVPAFTATDPTLDFGTAPEYDDMGGVPAAPSLDTITVPDSPSLTYPSLPSLAGVTLPDAIAVEVPEFTAEFEDDDLTAPTDTFSFNETDYSSALKTAIYNKLLSEITDGSYGLDTNDEDALFNRERDKESWNAQLLYEETKRNFAVSGFSIPTGSLNKALERATFQSMLKNSSVNRDIYLKRADLYWEGKKFVISSAISLEQILIGLHNSKWERALNAAKATVEMAIALFNAKVIRYNAKVAKYKAEADVFEAKIKAQIARVELYKAQVEAARVSVELGKNQVELYKAQYEALKHVVELYKAQVEAANIRLQGEKIKVDIYRAQVEGYSAAVGAQKYKFDAYEAKIKGELGKVAAFEARARAYAAQVEGTKAQVEVQRLVLQAWVETNKAAIEIYQSQVGEAKEVRDIAAKIYEMGMAGYKAGVDAFAAKAQSLSRIYDLGQAAMERSYRVQIAAFQAEVESARVQVQRLLGIIDAEAKLIGAATEQNTRIRAAAINMVNMNLGLSYHYGETNSFSQSQNTQQSVSCVDNYANHTSHATNYNHNWHYKG